MTFVTIEEIARLTNGKIIGDPSYKIRGVESIEKAGPAEAAFVDNPRYEHALQNSTAGVILLPPNLKIPEGKNGIIVEAPSAAFQKVIELFLKETPSGFSGIHPTAVIHPEAILGKDVHIGPNSVIDRKAVIGDGSIIGALSYIGPEVVIGSNAHIHAKVTIYERTLLGKNVTIHSGAVIGSPGFGYATDKNGHHTPLTHLGKVVVEDGVEIGSNTTIDRARFKETKLGKGTKIDNLVQIAHQVSLGENNLIVSQVGIAGSTKTGKNVVIGGQVGVIGHATITDNVMLAARAAVSKSITKPGVYSGAPATPIKEFNELFIYQRNLKKYVKRLEKLEQEQTRTSEIDS